MMTFPNTQGLIGSTLLWAPDGGVRGYIFYIHSRLLERATHLNEEYRGDH